MSIDVQNKILLIEDDVDLRETTKEYLAAEGFLVCIAEDGAKGIQQAIQHRPDAIVCDINMPGLTGYEVFNMLQQITTTAAIPFIFLSAKSSRDEILTGIHLGVSDYITKPFEMQELVDIINRRIEQRKKMTDQHDEKFDVLFKNTSTPACVIYQNALEYINPAFSELIGYCMDDLTGLSITNILHSQSLSSTLLTLEQCAEGAKKSFDITSKVLTKEQQEITIKIKGSQALIRGEPRIICTIINEKDNVDPKKVTKPKMVNIKLSKRELEVLDLVCQGYSNAEIAEKLFLSERTVEGHRSRLFSKSGVKNAVSLAMWAVKNNLVEV